MKLQSHVNYEGKNSEIVATYILKELGYEILHSRGLENRKMMTGRKHIHIFDKKIRAHYERIVGKLEKLDYKIKGESEWRKEMLKEYPDMVFPSIEYEEDFMIGDIICKKGGVDYLFDVKLKIFKEDKNMNVFYVTNNEVLNYDQLSKSGKVPVKILINLKKDDGYYYRIFDWCDFKYPKNYDPNRTLKTTIRLENGLDISKLKKFKNVKNYKFEKYLDISQIKKRTINLSQKTIESIIQHNKRAKKLQQEFRDRIAENGKN